MRTPILFYWSTISLAGMVLEVINMWIASNCGLISMSCPWDLIFGGYWVYWIVFGFGLLVCNLEQLKKLQGEKKEEDVMRRDE